MRIPITMLALLVVFCSKKTELRQVEGEEAAKLITQGYQVLDVRTSAEFKVGHIANALNVDFSAPNFSELAEKLERNRKYIVHCSANVPNGRTDRALQVLRRMGFSNLVSLRGGIVAWQQQKRPLVTQ